LNPTLTCTIGVVFKPTTTGTKNGILSLAASPGGPAMATLAGTAAAPAALMITPTAPVFGPVAQGTPTAQVFTVSNGGGAVSGTLSTAISGAADFAITTDNCKGKTLAATATCTLTVVMTPVAPPGSKAATLTVSASPGSSATSMLTGSSFTPAVLGLSPAAGSFGSVAAGGPTPKDLTFTLSNSGTQAAAGIKAAVTPGAGFSVLPATGTDCGTTLGGIPATCTIRVRFQPVALGAATGTLTVTATTGSAPSAVALTGNGYGIAAVPFDGDLRIAALGGMDGAGTAIVGRMQNAIDSFGFYWVINAATFTPIPPPPVSGETSSGDARAISSNGRVVTGVAAGGVAWSWTPGAAAAKSLNFVGGSAFPLGIDKTGSVIVGNVFTDAGVTAGFVWRSALAGGFEPLFGLQLLQVSDSGRIVGFADQGSTTWTSAGNMTTQPGTILTNASTVTAISGDGTIIVGADSNNAAVKWTNPFTGLPQALPTVPAGSASIALGVNQTGSAIVGQGPAGPLEWTSTGMTDIRAALAGGPTGAPPNLSSFVMNDARFVSADGKTIAGTGSFGGINEPWVARLP
jgi:hypothetical protein